MLPAIYRPISFREAVNSRRKSDSTVRVINIVAATMPMMPTATAPAGILAGSGHEPARAFSVQIESERGSTLCFVAFSRRKPVFTLLENALGALVDPRMPSDALTNPFAQ